MGKYKREEIIRKLERKGLKAKYHKCTQVLSRFEAPPNVCLGNKTRGYLDFLRVDVVQKKFKERFFRDEPKPKTARAWSFAWFANKEEAETWIADQKENRLLEIKIEKTEIVKTESMEYRACLQGVSV